MQFGIALYFITKREHMLRIRLYDGQIIFLDFNRMRREQESIQGLLFVDAINKVRLHKEEEFLDHLSVC